MSSKIRNGLVLAVGFCCLESQDHLPGHKALSREACASDDIRIDRVVQQLFKTSGCVCVYVCVCVCMSAKLTCTLPAVCPSLPVHSVWKSGSHEQGKLLLHGVYAALSLSFFLQGHSCWPALCWACGRTWKPCSPGTRDTATGCRLPESSLLTESLSVRSKVLRITFEKLWTGKLVMLVLQ